MKISMLSIFHSQNPSVLSRNELNYTLSINDSLMKEVTLHQKEVCLPSTNQCEYVTYLSESREAQLQTIAVTVTAENVVGRGEPQPCSPTISMLITLDLSFNTHALFMCLLFMNRYKK